MNTLLGRDFSELVVIPLQKSGRMVVLCLMFRARLGRVRGQAGHMSCMNLYRQEVAAAH
ncbi:MAG TPA: hypothetical protein VKE40_13935 [Gemmataceae bacterium]|nr:hypothetical protein [Gemmataceae bacterium]